MTWSWWQHYKYRRSYYYYYYHHYPHIYPVHVVGVSFSAFSVPRPFCVCLCLCPYYWAVTPRNDHELFEAETTKGPLVHLCFHYTE